MKLLRTSCAPSARATRRPPRLVWEALTCYTVPFGQDSIGRGRLGVWRGDETPAVGAAPGDPGHFLAHVELLAA